jgi:Ras-related protein Rab-6A
VFRRQVTLEEANTKATDLNIMFMETSAKAGHNVKSLFKKIAMSLVGMEKDNEAAEQQNTSPFSTFVGFYYC